jgi:EAL domain-containing protein (putative c-di-GMP-specific phosphodiesterase class I)
MKILLVDDDAFALRLTSHQLAALGYTDVTPQQSATAALRTLEGNVRAFDLILLDLQMPDLDGIEFVRHLAGLGYEGGLILVSGEDERIVQTATTLARSHALNVLDSLRKPVSPQQLRGVLDTPRPVLPLLPPLPELKPYAPDIIKHAIENGYITNFYQPKVELATGRVVGVEALARWQSPEHGLVFPDQFISQAEEHHLIDALTRAVLVDALQQTRRWHDAGFDIGIAMNVSMDNLSSLYFPDFLDEAARAAGVPNERIMLEVTESRLMKNALTTLDILARLRLKRIGLSIDDFGQGHSSLSQLRDIPFVELKIDRSFVHGADRDPATHAIVEASLGMARQLGLTSVAEGIEDRADWELMRSMGCDHAQGYFIARPMPPSMLDSWRQAWDAHRALLFST